jgi:alpha-N-arabinofuranosidase
MRNFKKSFLVIIALSIAGNLIAQCDFTTAYLKVHIDGRGYITSLQNITVQPNREFAAAADPSPLLCLYNSKKRIYYYPAGAAYSRETHIMTLTYKNGSVAGVRITVRDKKYIKLTLSFLSPRNGVDNIQWGEIHTNMTGILGELLGVARDTSASANYAIGLLSLDDATTGGPSTTVGDITPFEYLIHSPDTGRFPLPSSLKEGQRFSIGGNGISDVAFYSHAEEYYRIVYGNAAGVDSTGAISIVQHAADRRKPKDILFSLMPRMEANKPVHQELQAIPGADFIGSSVALWGCADSVALMTVIQQVVIAEGLPYPVLNGKWIKDPTRYVPDVLWTGGNYDSAVSYTSLLGFKAIEGWSLGEYYPDRGDNGNVSISIPFSTGKKTISEFTNAAGEKGVAFGLHTLQDFLQHGISSDVSPVPNDSLCYLQKRKLGNGISAADTVIVVDNPDYLDEIAGWEGHPLDANIIKIGKELIYYDGVSKAKPFVLKNVRRGYWGTVASGHQAGETLYKLQTNCYHGLTPDIFLQDKYADYYARLFKRNGMGYIDFDGEEGLFYQGYGEYSVKRFYSRLFAAVHALGMDGIRITGATLSGGSWHYHSTWNVGGGEHMYDNKTRTWGIEGKDLRNVTFGNYFPSTFGGNFELKPSSSVQEYENIEAVSVGQGVTYVMSLSEKSVAACPARYAILKAIRTWEDARAADAFPRWVKRELADPSQYFHLEEKDQGTWELFKVNADGSGREWWVTLSRDAGMGAAVAGRRDRLYRHGTEYHVSVRGSDANDGSVSHPFKTISAAADVAMPGDVITVHAGIYRERITPPRGGNSERERIVYQAAKGEKVEIRGSEVIKDWRKGENDTWVVKIPNSFFGKFNPYSDLIRGDWFSPTPKDRKYHTGAVYLNGDWLMEAAHKEDVLKAADNKNPLWWAEVDSTTTTIWAQFAHVDPNKETTEINVRQTIFYPDRPFINFITVRGFIMQDAATNWAPPTAEQMGLIGTHWSRGWIIENNVVQYSKCVGIALGKYGDEFDNKNTESAEGYVGTIRRALAFGWNKGTVGGHIVRNNHIAYCEQAGIVGSMGCSFSMIQGNTIHDIHVRQLFSGAEMAAIKFHGAVDVQIMNNRIYHSNLGIWLDWMAQGAQIKSNLMYDNARDIFLEVDHGPILVSNNILLSKASLLMNSSGAAFVHNLFGGKIDVIDYDSRLTPYMKPHSTYVVALHDNPGGDIQFINNLFVNGGDASRYSKAILPVVFAGNVYTKGSVRAAREQDALVDEDFDASVHLSGDGNAMYLKIALDKKWLASRRKLVTGRSLAKAIVPDLPFENADGTELRIDTDYFGKNRNVDSPSPGPFEITKDGARQIQVWEAEDNTLNAGITHTPCAECSPPARIQ